MPNERTAGELAHSKAVREMFSGIARKYDFLNHFLSINIDKHWRRLVRRKLEDVLRDEKALVLDVACGTGDLSIELQKNFPAKIIGTDFCRPMLAVAFDKNDQYNLQIPYLEADGMNLAFAENSFDAVTIAFGLRNFSNWESGIEELRRVLKPNGKLVILEFSTPILPGFKQLFNLYFTQILPRIGGAVSGSPRAYQYLPDSVSRFPDQRGLAKLMENAGFANIEFQNLSAGIAAIHSGNKV